MTTHTINCLQAGRVVVDCNPLNEITLLVTGYPRVASLTMDLDQCAALIFALEQQLELLALRKDRQAVPA